MQNNYGDEGMHTLVFRNREFIMLSSRRLYVESWLWIRFFFPQEVKTVEVVFTNVSADLSNAVN